MKFIQTAFIILSLAVFIPQGVAKEKKNGTPFYDLGDKRELFVDNFFISSLEGDVRQKLHSPVPDEIVLSLNEPHEKSHLRYPYWKDPAQDPGLMCSDSANVLWFHR